MTKITSDNDLVDFIYNIIRNDTLNLKSKDFELPDIEFSNYPNLMFNVKGESYSSTLTTPLLNALSGLTSEIQKSYCLIKYQTSNLQRLTVEDKQDIDIIFKIKEGSSEGESDNSKIANGIFSIIKEGMEGMNGWQKLTVLVLFISVIGGLGYNWLDNQAVESSAEMNTLDKAISSLAESNKDALSLLKSYGKTALSEEITAHAEASQTIFFKEIAKDPNAEQATLNKSTINREQLDEYKKRITKQKEKTPRVDLFIIKGIEVYAPLYIETDIDISVIREADDTEFTLRTSLELMSEQELTELKSALGTNNLIKIAYEEIKENGKITKSQFVRIEK